MKYIWYIIVFAYALSYDAVTDDIARSTAPDWVFYGYEFLPLVLIPFVAVYSLLKNKK